MSGAIDFSRHFAQKDVESKIRASRDDLLIIMQSEHKRLEEKINISVKRLEDKIDISVKRLEDKIDGVEKRIGGVEKRIDGVEKRIDDVEKRLDVKIDGVEQRLGSKIDQVLSMKKWAVGMFVTIMLAIAALAAPNIISLIR